MSLDSGKNLTPPEYKSSVAAPALGTPSTDSHSTVFPQGDGNHSDSNLISNHGQNHITSENAQPFQENSGRDSLASKPEQSADVRQDEKSNTNLESENILSNALLDIQLVVLGDSGVTRETARNLLKDKSTLDGAQASRETKTIAREVWEIFEYLRKLQKSYLEGKNPTLTLQSVLESVSTANQAITAIAACYEVSLQKQNGQANRDGLTLENTGIPLRELKGGIGLSTQIIDVNQDAGSELRSEDILEMTKPELVSNAAEQLHQSYQIYHKQEERILQILREFVTEEKGDDGTTLMATTLIDLLDADFSSLPEKWQKVNEISARNILVILRVLLPDQAFDCIFPKDGNRQEKDTSQNPITIDKILNDSNLIYGINAALYAIWSKRPVIENGKRNNPLFHCNSYAEFTRISNGGDPDEGWENFSKSYRDFLKTNKETYAKMLLNSGVVDTNDDKEISDEEIDSFDLKLIKKMVSAQAKSELRKDARMMILFLGGLFSKNTNN